jgi:hypothetical protein
MIRIVPSMEHRRIVVSITNERQVVVLVPHGAFRTTPLRQAATEISEDARERRDWRGLLRTGSCDSGLIDRWQCHSDCSASSRKIRRSKRGRPFLDCALGWHRAAP